MKERGLTAPEHLETPPQIEPRFFVYWEAYQDLQTERRTTRGQIPINSILAYARNYGIDPDTLKRIIWEVDKILLTHWKGIDEAAERKRKAEAAAAKHRAVGGRK